MTGKRFYNNVVKYLEGILEFYAMYIAPVAVRGRWPSEYCKKVDTVREQIIEQSYPIASQTVRDLTDNGMCLNDIFLFTLRLGFAHQPDFRAVSEDKDPQAANDPPS